MKPIAHRAYNKYHYSLILLRELVSTEFRLRYQGSVLGYLWSILKPLFLFVILYVVMVNFLKIGAGIPHWPISMLLGIVLWNFFAEVTNNGVTSIVNRGDVIRKINFPKYVIVVAASVSALINLLINLVVIAIFMAVSGVEVSWGALLSPLYILEIFTLALGLGFILSALFVKLRDLNYIWEIIMQALFYASAVIFPISTVIEKHTHLATLLMLNPITQSIQDIRHSLIDPVNPTLATVAPHQPLLTLIPVGLVIIVFVVGAVYFRKQSPSFAENV